MRVLFIVPPYRTCDAFYARLFPMPMASVLLGSVLQQSGHKVEVQDFLVPMQSHTTPTPPGFAGKGAPPYRHWGWPMEDCLVWIRKNLKRFDVVCLHGQQCNLWETVEILAREVRRLGKPLVMGGAYCTTAPDEAKRRFKPDVMVIGEGEWVIEKAVRYAAKGRHDIIVRSKHNELSGLPLPDWSLVDLDDYPRCDGRKRGALFVTRGCPWECQFCSVPTVVGPGYRRQSRERIAAELENLWNYGVRYFSFLDDNLFANLRGVNDTLGAIDDVKLKHPGFLKASRFYCEEGIEVRMGAKPGIVQRIIEHNFVDVAFAVESLNREAMYSQKKPYKPEHLAQLTAECRRLGASVRAFYILGFPEDTLFSVARDMVAFAALGLGVRSNNLKFYPNTPMTLKQQKADKLPGFDWRLSSWYTPKVGALKWMEIRHLKSVLSAIGFAAGELGLDPFHSDFKDIQYAMAEHGFQLQLLDGTVEIVGNMFRYNRIAILAELLCCRHVDSAGAVSKRVGKQLVRATGTTEPKDICQAALLAAMRNERFVDSRPVSLFS